MVPGAISSPHRLASVAQLLGALLDGLAPVAPVSRRVEQAVGHVLAQPLTAALDVPTGAIALRRGHPASSLDLIGASAQAPVPLMTRPPCLEAGDALPSGADALLDPDSVEDQGGWLAALEAPAPGQWVRLRGHDARAGAVLLEAGRVLNADAALAARLAGVDEVTVRQPAVAIEIDDEATAGWLSARLLGVGCKLDPRGPLVLREAGQAAPRLALSAAESAWAERRGERIEIELPARFSGVVAAWVALVVPVLGRFVDRAPATFPVRLDAKASSALGLTELVLLRRLGGGAVPLSVGEMTLSALAQADAVCLIEPDSEGHPVGAMIDAMALDEPFRRPAT